MNSTTMMDRIGICTALHSNSEACAVSPYTATGIHYRNHSAIVQGVAGVQSTRRKAESLKSMKYDSVCENVYDRAKTAKTKRHNLYDFDQKSQKCKNVNNSHVYFYTSLN